MIDTPDQLLTNAVNDFGRAETATGRMILVYAVEALDALCRAAALADLPTAFPELSAATRSAIFQASAPIAEATTSTPFALPEGKIKAFLAAAAGLVTYGERNLDTDRILYAGLLRSELMACLIKSQIASRLDPLARLAQFNRASLEMPFGHPVN